MTHLHRLLCAGVALAAMTGLAHAAPADGRKLIADQYICVFKPTVAREQVRAEADRAVKAQGGQLLHSYRHTIRGFATRMPAQALSRMKAANRNIAYCEQDQIAEASYLQRGGKPPKDGGGSTSPTQTTPWGITRVGGPVTYSGTNLAYVIDSGIDLDHPDLNVAQSGNFSVFNNDPNDQNGHGTHVAGTIAAINNTIGVVGVAAGAPVVSVRVLDRRGSGSFSGVIAGVDFVKANGKAGDVANMSLGGGFSQALNDAVIAASSVVKFVIAAGNSGAHAKDYSPASANGPNIYTVSASDSSDRLASFSNWGNPPVDYAEPGVSVNSTYKDGGYTTLSGTSMAAPHLAGILLLGSVRNGGTITGDKDSSPDTIGVR